jgi:hypothetical protein
VINPRTEDDTPAIDEWASLDRICLGIANKTRRNNHLISALQGSG